MKIKSKYESPLVLESMYITECTFKKKPVDVDDLELDVSVNRSIAKVTDEVFQVTLDVTVTDVDTNIFVNVKGCAIFSTQQVNMDIIEKNTIAIMFPYIRSYISSVTTQPGMSPIVLPAMNVIAMVSDSMCNK